MVARHEELSVKAQYSHEPTARMMMKLIPAATLESKVENPKKCPKRLRPRSMTTVSSRAPTHSMQMSMAPAHTRSQNPAYSKGSDVVCCEDKERLDPGDLALGADGSANTS